MNLMLFGKTFKLASLCLLIGLMASVISYFLHLSWLFLAMFAIATFIASLKDIRFGLWIAFLELASSAHGQLFSVSIGGFNVSIRMVVFITVMLVWLVGIIRLKYSLQKNDLRLLGIIILGLAVVCGFVVGFIHQPFADVFADGNAYFYLFYILPIVSISWTVLDRNNAIQSLTATTIYQFVTTGVLLFLFTHFDESFLYSTYKFIRDVRLAEITQTGFGFVRVFEQTQLFAIVFLLLIIPYLYEKLSRRDSLILIGCVIVSSATTFSSLSRSFLSGFVLSLVVIICLMFYIHKKIKIIFFGTGKWLIGLFFGLVLLLFIALFPFPLSRVTDSSHLLSDRVTTNDVASSSRWNLLSPMIRTISESPLFGSGFGKTVSYISNDPRVRAEHQSGLHATYAMELGWFELWLKMGILGAIGYLVFGFLLCLSAFRLLNTPKRAIGAWVGSVTIAIFTTHFFSPYLNHPLGIGLLLFLLVFISSQELRVPALVISKQKTRQNTFAVSEIVCSSSECRIQK